MKKNGLDKNDKISMLKAIAIVLVAEIIIALIIAGIVFIIHKNSINNEDRIINKVNKILILPNEKPIINTIEDATGLKKESPFYNNVRNGDKILIYSNSAKVIIYREKENKIINVGPIINDNDTDGNIN